MSWAVDAIIAVRDAATEKKLTTLAADVDKIRSKIVATKEGGAITGEERLREFLAGLLRRLSMATKAAPPIPRSPVPTPWPANSKM